jgi:hypothetical protein
MSRLVCDAGAADLTSVFAPDRGAAAPSGPGLGPLALATAGRIDRAAAARQAQVCRRVAAASG